jgi:SAM-dependent methyltransferase
MAALLHLGATAVTIGSISTLPSVRAADSGAAYTFKASRFSSHSIILACLTADGNGRRVLDVGCGPGHLARILADRGYRVTGIERTSPPADEFPGNVTFRMADLDEGLPPLDGCYDYVLCADVLEHLRDPLRLLREIRAVLAEGGRIIASLPNSGHAYFRWNVMLGRFPQHDRGLFDATHLHFYAWDGWQKLLTAGGFEIERVYPTGVPVGLALESWKDSALVRSLEWCSYQSARIWKTMCAYQFVVIARAKE